MEGNFKELPGNKLKRFTARMSTEQEGETGKTEKTPSRAYDDNELDRILGNTKLDEFELIDSLLEQLHVGNLLQENTGVGTALTTDMKSTSKLAS